MLLGWLGGYELLLVAAIFLLLFGGARLPGLMRNMGRSINEFKAGLKDSSLDPKAIEESEAERSRSNV